MLYKNPEKSADFEILAEVPGKFLEGRKYTPLYPYFHDKYPDAFRVVCDDYVKSDSGTGIVHQAPAFGEDDFRVCVERKVISSGTEV